MGKLEKANDILVKMIDFLFVLKDEINDYTLQPEERDAMFHCIDAMLANMVINIKYLDSIKAFEAIEDELNARGIEIDITIRPRNSGEDLI